MLEVSESGYYAWRSRPPSPRVIRHAWLTDLHTVELLMRRVGLQGVTGRPKDRRGLRPEATAADLVQRQFTRTGPDQLWVTDITEHPTREGKLYCAVVLDACSRRVIGWSIEITPTAALVPGALGMAIQSRKPTAGTLIHSDHGVQFTSWAFSQRAKSSGLLPSMGGVGACYDNALIESFWSRMQVELLDRHRWRTRLELANVAVTFHDLGFPSYENILIARRETLEQDKDILVRYLRAVIKGWELNRKDIAAGARKTFELYGRDNSLDLAQQTEDNKRQMPLMESSVTGEQGLFQMSLEDVAGPQYEALRRAGVEPLSDVESFVTLDVLDAAYQGKTSLLG